MRDATRFSFDAWRSLRPGVLVCTAQPDAVTVGCVLGDDHAFLIDAGSSPGQGAALAASVQDQFGRTIDGVVITHGHYDHWFGLAGVRATASWGQANLAAEARDCVDAEVAYGYGFSPELIMPPRVLVDDRLTVDLGGRALHLVSCAPAHSNTDLIVRVPDADVVFMGDLVEQAGEPSFGPDCTLSHWGAAIQQALAGTGPDTLLVPGHGIPVGPDFARAQADGIRALAERARVLWEQGVLLPDALNSLTVPAEVPWPFGPSTIRDALIVAYAEFGNRAGLPA